jgi:hypothetical protein
MAMATYVFWEETPEGKFHAVGEAELPPGTTFESGLPTPHATMATEKLTDKIVYLRSGSNMALSLIEAQLAEDKPS